MSPEEEAKVITHMRVEAAENLKKAAEKSASRWIKNHRVKTVFSGGNKEATTSEKKPIRYPSASGMGRTSSLALRGALTHQTLKAILIMRRRRRIKMRMRNRKKKKRWRRRKK